MIVGSNQQDFSPSESRHLLDNLELFDVVEKDIAKGAFLIDKGMIKYTGQYVAMKRAQTEKAYNSLINEFKMLCKFTHPAVQSIIGF